MLLSKMANGDEFRSEHASVGSFLRDRRTAIVKFEN
jgi:hypothetical protein